MGRIVQFQGRQIQFPDGASDADIQAALASGADTSTAASLRNPDGTYGQPPAGEIIHGADRSYISDHPEINTVRDSGATEDAVMTALKRRGQTNDIGASATSPFVQGLTFNSADEMASGVNSLIGAIMGNNPVDTFAEEQERQRQQLARVREENPVTSAATSVLGGLYSGAGAATNGLTMVGKMANEGVRNLLPRMAAGAAEGGLYGELAGLFGGDGGLANRAKEAGANLPLSAALGAAAVPAVNLANIAWGPVTRTVRALWNSKDVAAEKLAVAMANDKTDVNAVADRVKQAVLDGIPEYKMVDAAGKNAQRLGAVAAKTPGEFRNTVSDQMAARQMGQADRIGGYVDDALGDGDNAFRTQEALVDARKLKARPIYDKAYADPVPADLPVDEMLARPSVRDAVSSAKRVAAEDQVPITDLFAETTNAAGEPVSIPTMRGWDYVKRELDAKVNQLYKAGDTTAATATKDTRNALREALSKNANYAEALKTYSDDSATIDAMKTGKDLISARNPDEAKSTMLAVKPEDKQFAKLGAARELGVKLDNMRGGQDKTLAFDTPNMQGKLETIIDDPVVKAVLMKQLGLEKDMHRAGQTLLGGSTTYENLIDGATMNNNGGALAALVTGQPWRALSLAAGTAMGKLGRLAGGMNEEGAKTIGDYLLSSDPDKIRSLADLYQQMLARKTAPSVVPAVIDAGANAPRTKQENR